MLSVLVRRPDTWRYHQQNLGLSLIGSVKAREICRYIWNTAFAAEQTSCKNYPPL